MPVVPLKNPLDEMATVYRACRFLNLDIPPEQISRIGKIISERFEGTPKRLFVIENNRMIKVNVYPSGFVPEMLSIIKECCVPEKKKRKRIKTITKM